ncbi:MAG: hypothetical protein GXO10_01670, partial [Crenarchaeota archaeon]|nr:hypothetical protein [Thermoproteota archaeon]
KADALYYMTLCWCCGGGRLSFKIKYGDDYKYSQVLDLVRKYKLINILTNSDVAEYIARSDRRFITFFYKRTEEKLCELSENALQVADIIRRFKIYETLTEGDVNTLLYSSIMINTLLRKIVRSIYKARLAIFELVKTGLLVTCLWSPYEGLPHMYRIPHYSINIWQRTKLI